MVGRPKRVSVRSKQDFQVGMMARVLVAGGGGFVGTALVGVLASAGHDTSVMTTGSATSFKNVHVTRLDRWHPNRVAEADASAGYDWIFNAAAYGVDPSQGDPEAARLANAELPLAFVDLARRAGASALVHVGSAFEYAGLSERRPLCESDPLETEKTYAASKVAGSLGVIEAARKSGVNAVVARLFGVYGAGERPWRLLPSLHSRLSVGQAVPLSEGSQVRAWRPWRQRLPEPLEPLGLSISAPALGSRSAALPRPLPTGWALRGTSCSLAQYRCARER